MTIQALIIDLDGTLVDTLGDFELALTAMLADFGLPSVPRSFIEHTVGKGSEHLIRSTLAFVQNQALAPEKRAQAAIKTIALEEAYSRYQQHYRRVNGQASVVYAGVREGLEALGARGLPLACLTNKPLAFAQQLLEAKGLSNYFGLVFGGDSFDRKKPDPLPLVKTCEALGTLPKHTLMIGDSSNDARAARGAACPVLLMRYGYNHGEPIEGVDCDGLLDSMSQVPTWLDQRSHV